MKKLITNVIAALWPPLFRGGLGLLMTSFCEKLFWVYLCSQANGNHGVVKRLV